MKEIYCDICGEKISEIGHYYKLILKVIRGPSENEESFDVCVKCKLDLIRWIRVRKQFQNT